MDGQLNRRNGSGNRIKRGEYKENSEPDAQTSTCVQSAPLFSCIYMPISVIIGALFLLRCSRPGSVFSELGCYAFVRLAFLPAGGNLRRRSAAPLEPKHSSLPSKLVERCSSPRENMLFRLDGVERKHEDDTTSAERFRDGR